VTNVVPFLARASQQLIAEAQEENQRLDDTVEAYVTKLKKDHWSILMQLRAMWGKNTVVDHLRSLADKIEKFEK
jgi:hypothetical protein